MRAAQWPLPIYAPKVVRPLGRAVDLVDADQADADLAGRGLRRWANPTDDGLGHELLGREKEHIQLTAAGLLQHRGRLLRLCVYSSGRGGGVREAAQGGA